MNKKDIKILNNFIDKNSKFMEYSTRQDLINLVRALEYSASDQTDFDKKIIKKYS